MRIIGGKDYYDGGAAYGTDPSRVFTRNNHATSKPSETPRLERLDNTSFAAYAPGEKRWINKKVPVSPIYVVFCGTRYAGAYHRRSSWSGNTRTTHYDTAWTADGIRELVKAHGGAFTEKEKWHYEWHDYIYDNTLDEFIEPKPLQGSDLDFIIQNNILVSIGLYEGSRHKSNVDWFDNTDGLKNFGFAGVLDTWAAFQQLDQFLGSQLAKEEDNMVRLSDAELIAKHGFDKLNFRNQTHAGKPRGRT